MIARPLVWKRLGHPHRWAAASVLAGVAGLAGGVFFWDGGLFPRAWPLAAGAIFGIALQRGELSFVRAWRDLIVLKDSGQLIAFVAALAVAGSLTLGGVALSGATETPAGARIGPVSWALPLAAFAFGVGAVVARGSLMVHLRRLGEGSLVALPALAATFAGFVVAIATWPFIYAHALDGAPAPWLPGMLGASAALGVQLAALAACLVWLKTFRARDERPAAGDRFSVAPWPPIAAGALVGLLAAASYAVGEPLGLSAECAAVARALATALGLVPHELPGLDQGIGGLVVPLRGFEFSGHVVIVTGVVLGAFAAALVSGRFRIQGCSTREGVEMALGGLLIGWGAMTALGTVTGAGISGVAVGAVSSWVFLIFASAGIAFALRLDPRPAMTAPKPALRSPSQNRRGRKRAGAHDRLPQKDST